jgi:CSLREA domain-containing protein
VALGSLLGIALSAGAFRSPEVARAAGARAAGLAAAPWVVNTTADEVNGGCDAAHCSLREALQAAVAAPEGTVVAFAIPPTDPGCDAAGVCTIRPLSALPSIVTALTIDGYTQAGAKPNSAPLGSAIDAVLKIVLDGSEIPGCCPVGLHLRAGPGTAVRGLVIHGFYRGIQIEATGVAVEGNFIGTDASGLEPRPNVCSGILISFGSGVVGGPAPESRNLISGNGCGGLELGRIGGNVVQGNYVGADATGHAPLPNSRTGVRAYNLSPDNQIGGDSDGEANLIAFNATAGIDVDGVGGPAVRNRLSRNRIFANGIGILLEEGANDGIAAPAFETVEPTAAIGTACEGCLVEVFSDRAGQGGHFEGTALADAGGVWMFAPGRYLQGPFLTATATDPDGNTSEFSGPVDASFRPGDANCDRRISAADVSGVLASIAGMSTCASGDANCDDRVDGADADTVVALIFAPTEAPTACLP